MARWVEYKHTELLNNEHQFSESGTFFCYIRALNILDIFGCTRIQTFPKNALKSSQKKPRSSKNARFSFYC